MSSFSDQRYLESKRTVDDRALNRRVLEQLASELDRRGNQLRVLELGAGIGTMVSRLVEWRLLRRAEYTLLDQSVELLTAARERLTAWARARGFSVEGRGERLEIAGSGAELSLHFVPAELHAFLGSEAGPRGVDLLIANAFLDVVDVPATLPRLFERAAPDAIYWFSINFDGETTLLPEHPSDAKLLSVYHRSMDERVRDGRPSGDSKTGRHLFEHLPRAGASVLSAGASDWVVHPIDGTYAADESYFLQHLVHTIQAELERHAEVSKPELEAWVELRRAQIARGELCLVAHQLDFFGRVRA